MVDYIKLSQFPYLSALSATAYVPIIQNNENWVIYVEDLVSQVLSLSGIGRTVTHTTIPVNNEVIRLDDSPELIRNNTTLFLRPTEALSALTIVLPSDCKNGQVTTILSELTVTVTISATELVGSTLTSLLPFETYNYQCFNETTGSWLRLS